MVALYACQIFDQYFHGVDRNDQLRGAGYGLVLHFKARKYTIKFFLGIIDILLSNAWLYYRWYNPKKRKEHRAWMNDLADDMLAFNPMGDPMHPTGGQHQQEKEKTPHTHTLKQFGICASTKRRYRAKCPMCSRGKKRRASQGCPDCNVALHPQCFEAWHRLSESERALKKRRHRRLSFHDDSAEEQRDLS